MMKKCFAEGRPGTQFDYEGMRGECNLCHERVYVQREGDRLVRRHDPNPEQRIGVVACANPELRPAPVIKVGHVYPSLRRDDPTGKAEVLSVVNGRVTFDYCVGGSDGMGDLTINDFLYYWVDPAKATPPLGARLAESAIFYPLPNDRPQMYEHRCPKCGVETTAEGKLFACPDCATVSPALCGCVPETRREPKVGDVWEWTRGILVGGTGERVTVTKVADEFVQFTSNNSDEWALLDFAKDFTFVSAAPDATPAPQRYVDPTFGITDVVISPEEMARISPLTSNYSFTAPAPLDPIAPESDDEIDDDTFLLRMDTSLPEPMVCAKCGNRDMVAQSEFVAPTPDGAKPLPCPNVQLTLNKREGEIVLLALGFMASEWCAGNPESQSEVRALCERLRNATDPWHYPEKGDVPDTSREVLAQFVDGGWAVSHCVCVAGCHWFYGDRGVARSPVKRWQELPGGEE